FLWDRGAGRPAFSDRGPLRLSKVFALRPDGGQVATVGFDGVLRLCVPDSGEVLREFPGPAAIQRLAYSPDGKQLAGAEGDRVTLWDAATGRELAVLRGLLSPAQRLVFSPDGRRLVTAGGNGLNGETKVWDVATGREVCVLRGPRGEDHAVAFSPDGRLLATG